MRRRTFWFSASEISVTLRRFGRKRRRVLLLAWLTLLPDITALPVSSQARDIFQATFKSRTGQMNVAHQKGWRAVSSSGRMEELAFHSVIFGKRQPRRRRPVARAAIHRFA